MAVSATVPAALGGRFAATVPSEAGVCQLTETCSHAERHEVPLSQQESREGDALGPVVRSVEEVGPVEGFGQ